MVNYNNGKIYKIEPVSGGEISDVYIGSTTKNRLCERMSCHRSGYKRWKEEKSGYCSVYDLFEKYGVENCHIVLVEAVSVSSKDELFVREGYWIKSIGCVNCNIAGQSRQERINSYYQKNKVTILQQKKVYRETNRENNPEYRDNINDYHKQYYINNKNKFKQYYENSKLKKESL